MKLNKHWPWIVTGVIATGVAAGGIAYLHGALAQRHAERAALHAERLDIEARRDRIPALERRCNELRERFAEARPGTVGTTLDGLTQFTKGLGVQRFGVTTGDPAWVGDSTVTPITVSFDGDFSTTFEMVGHIERDHNAMTVRRLVLSHEAEAADGTLAVSMLLETAMDEGGLQ